MQVSEPERSLWSNPTDVVQCLLGLLSLAFSLYATSVGFHNTIFDFHGFRQAQTAISTDSILHGGSILKYELPVLGPPWSVPFEFPLYQMIVAGVVKCLTTALDETGRFVSILCYYLCFLPLASILVRLGLRGTQLVAPLALFAVSPLYVFASRLFMIESTALLLSLLYADQMFRLVWGEKRWQVRHMIGATFLGVLAGIVKVTTLAPFFALGASLAAWRIWVDREKGQVSLRTPALQTLCCIVLPVAATWRWTKFADSVKEQNPFGAVLTSKALTAWNFGTFAERLHPRLYLQLFEGADNHVGSVWVAVAVLAVYTWMYRRWNRIAAACVVLYIGAMLLFFNLHVIHEYYSYANAIFLVVGVGTLISSMMKGPGRAAWVGVALLILEMGACGFRYFTHFYPVQHNNAAGRPQAAATIDRVTKADDVIVVVGLDWSAELPYQSHRRAIMDATFGSTRQTAIPGPLLQAAIANAHAYHVTAVVACAPGRYVPYLPVVLQQADMRSSTNLHADDCDIYQRKTTGAVAESRNQAHPDPRR